MALLGRRGAVLPDRDRLRAARPGAATRAAHWQRVDAGPRRRQPDAGRRRQPHRHRGGRRRRDASPSTAARSSPTTRGAKVEPRPPHEGEAVLTATFDLDDARDQRARLGPVPRPPAGPLRPDPEPRRARAGDLTGGSGCRQATIGQRGERPAGVTPGPHSVSWPGSTGPPTGHERVSFRPVGPPVEPEGDRDGGAPARGSGRPRWRSRPGARRGPGGRRRPPAARRRRGRPPRRPAGRGRGGRSRRGAARTGRGGGGRARDG